MKKNILCALMAIVMIMSLIASLGIPAFAAEHSDDDPRVILQDGQGNEKTIWFQGLYTLPECEFTAPEGQRFKCWRVDGRKNMMPGEQTYTDLRTVITAVWEPLPVVIFEADGGTNAMAPVPTEGDYALPECGFTAPEGKQFKCWQVNGEEKQPGEVVAVDADITITAVWEDIPVEPTEEPTEAPTEEPTEAFEQDDGEKEFDPIVLIIVLIIVLVAVVAAGAGVLVTVLVLKKKKD